MMGESEIIEKKNTFSPPKKIVIVKPVMRMRNPNVNDPEHEAFFLFGNATIEFCLPQDRQGNLLNPFTSKEEQDWLEKKLDLDLNIHKKRDNYWVRAKVKLGKDDLKLDLTKPEHYIEYIILKRNTLYIAPSGEEINNKATYRYALVSEEFETKKKVSSAQKKKAAYKAAARLEADGKEAMIDFLKVYGKKVSEASKDEFLVAEIDTIIDEKIDDFLAIIADSENYEMKLLISKAVDAGVINKQGRKYFLPGGDPLCGVGSTPVIQSAIDYLNAKANQDILTMIKARIDNAKEK